MIKIKQGSFINPDTGIEKEVVVRAISPNKIKDIVIGGGIMLVGIIYLTSSAFKNGVEKMNCAELQTLVDLGLTDDTIMNDKS